MTDSPPPASHVDLLERPLFAHLATIRPDGAPQSSVMWFDWDGQRVRFTHTKKRQKFRNIANEPRVALSIADPDDAYRFLEVRGVVETTEHDPTGAFYDRLAVRYGSPNRVRDPEVRVVLTVKPTAFVAVDRGQVVKH